MIKLIEFKNDNHSFPIYSHFPLCSTASPLNSHLSSSLLPQPSPHRHHVYSIPPHCPLSSRAFPTSLSLHLIPAPTSTAPHLRVPLPPNTLPAPPRTALPYSLRAFSVPSAAPPPSSLLRPLTLPQKKRVLPLRELCFLRIFSAYS